MSQKTDFVYSQNSEPHRLRTKQILKEHPQVRQLIAKILLGFFPINCLT